MSAGATSSVATAKPTAVIPLVRVVRRCLPLGLPLGLVAPSLVWIALDRSIWPWDPAWYGRVSIELWATLRTDANQWTTAMTHAFGAKPPAIAWLGQFFVPLGEIVGRDAFALLLSVVACQAASLTLVYLAVRRLGGVAAGGVAAFVVGASPLFVAMSHEYFAEPIQTLAVAGLLFVLAGAADQRAALTLAQLPGVIALGMLAKLSSPAYMAPLAAGAILLVLLHRGRPVHQRPLWGDAAFIATGIVSSLLVLGALGWYRINLDAAVDHARLASADTGLYGIDRGFLRQFPDWVDRLRGATFLPVVWIVVGVLTAAALALAVRGGRQVRVRDPRIVSVAACGVAVVVVLAALASQPNQETRYLLPLVPLVAVPVALTLAAGRRQALVALAGVAMVVQFALVTLQSFGHARGALVSYPVVAPVRDERSANALEEVVAQTCTNASASRINMVGVDYPWLNHNTLELLAFARYAERGRRCYYTALGYAENDPEVAWKRVREFDPPFYISVDYGNPRNPLPPSQAAAVARSDAFNRINVAIFTRVKRSPEFKLVPESRSSGLVVFRAVDGS